MDKPRQLRSLTRRSRKNPALVSAQVSHVREDISVVVTLYVKPGTTIRDAVEQSGIRKIVKNMKLAEGRVRILGEIRPLDTVVQKNDRIEIDHPPVITPGKTRQKRARKATSAPNLPEKKEKQMFK